MKEYLVVVRNEEEPRMYNMSKEEVEERLNDDWAFPKPFNVLKGIPPLDDFPSRSVLIFKGKSCGSEAVETIVKHRLVD